MLLSPIYFVVFVLISQFVLTNLVVAVLMKHLDESNKDAGPAAPGGSTAGDGAATDVGTDDGRLTDKEDQLLEDGAGKEQRLTHEERELWNQVKEETVY